MAKSNAIRILNTLMRYDRPLSTNEICEIAECDRKTVYSSVATLELNGFGIEVCKIRSGQNTYQFKSIHGLNNL